jgi:hypothetical protein
MDVATLRVNVIEQAKSDVTAYPPSTTSQHDFLAATEIGALIDDDVLDAFAVVEGPDEVP